jgi:hypothetical protein
VKVCGFAFDHHKGFSIYAARPVCRGQHFQQMPEPIKGDLTGWFAIVPAHGLISGGGFSVTHVFSFCSQ